MCSWQTNVTTLSEVVLVSTERKLKMEIMEDF